MAQWRSCFLAAAIVVTLGCSGTSKPYQTAPVSGRVTLDGQPLANARVTFLPNQPPRAGSLSAPEAFGETDAEGRYELNTVFGDPGGGIGKSRVMISTRKTEPDPTNPDRNKEFAPERVPNKYFTSESPLVIDVPAAGTRAANFELMSR